MARLVGQPASPCVGRSKGCTQSLLPTVTSRPVGCGQSRSLISFRFTINRSAQSHQLIICVQNGRMIPVDCLADSRKRRVKLAATAVTILLPRIDRCSSLHPTNNIVWVNFVFAADLEHDAAHEWRCWGNINLSELFRHLDLQQKFYRPSIGVRLARFFYFWFRSFGNSF